MTNHRRCLKLLYAIQILLIASCDRSYNHYVKSYVLSYQEIKQIALNEDISNDGFPNIQLTAGGGGFVWFKSTGAAKKEYEQLCEKNGDISYNRVVSLRMDEPKGYAFYPEIIGIDVVTLDNYDEEHFMGDKVNDIFKLMYVSATDYVRGGYSDTESLLLREKIISDILPSELELLMDMNREHIHIKPAKRPKFSNKINISVTLNLETGENCSDTIEMSFTE